MKSRTQGGMILPKKLLKVLFDNKLVLIRLTDANAGPFKGFLDIHKQVHISKLRNKIEDSFRKPKYIITIRGRGYKLGVPRNF